MEIDVTHAPDRNRYEITADCAHAGHASYVDDGSVRAIMHTWIEDEFEGQGLGSKLILFALGDIRANDLQVLPKCPFVPKVIKDNPDFIELVPENQRKKYGLA